MFTFKVKDSQFSAAGWCGNRPQCVAIAKTSKGVAIRDTKDNSKTTLFFTHEEFDAFKNGIKVGKLD